MKRGSSLLFVLLCVTLVGVPWPSPGAEVSAGVNGGRRVDLDVLFVGAHPDDEAFNLSTFGRWDEYSGVKTGVVTITRGEGGGNAVGPEEGPPLGLLRETEERRAVRRAGINDIFYLDTVDFYYTVSAALTEDVWGHDETLEKIVRLVRATRPEVIVTMDPAPTPGNHGHHQYAARLATEAFYAAADPGVFPEQLTREGLSAWRSASIFRQGANTDGTPTGPGCDVTALEPTDNIFAVWDGRWSARHDMRWSQVEVEAQREYASQGWSVFGDAPSEPADIPCDLYTLIDSRVPLAEHTDRPTAMLEGAVATHEAGLPPRTELYLTSEDFYVVGGETFEVSAHVRSGDDGLGSSSVSLSLPPGWQVEGSGDLGMVEPLKTTDVTFMVTPPADASPSVRTSVGATLTTEVGSGTTNRAVEVVPPVRGTLEPLPQVADFRRWVRRVGVEQLDSLLVDRLSIGRGAGAPAGVDLTNYSREAQSGLVRFKTGAGFSMAPTERRFTALAPGATERVVVRAANTDPGLPVSNMGGDEGDYPFDIVTQAGGITDRKLAAFNLVPVTRVAEATAAPTLDGVVSAGEYHGSSLNLSRLWEGEPPDSRADASGRARVVWADGALYLGVEVADDKLGTVLSQSDAKRHWRTDSVEIAIDPRGDSENTSSTFKVGIFPTTRASKEGNPPAAYRDADAHQGPIEQTAPGMKIASKVSSPYDGYAIETRIPFSELPAAMHPRRNGLDIFIYDSDTQDKVGQTRLGWSTWEGVQGDPYRWGHAYLEGYRAPDRSRDKPIIPEVATRSVRSPRSILQSARNGVPLAAAPAVTPGTSLRVTSGPRLEVNALSVTLKASDRGRAHLFAWDGRRSRAEAVVALDPKTPIEVSWTLAERDRAALEEGGRVLVGWRSFGRTQSLAPRIR